MKAMTGVLPLGLIFVAPLVFSVLFMLPDFTDFAAFQAFFAHPQFAGALALTLFTGITSTALSIVLALIIAARLHRKAMSHAGMMLALPHLALAVGLAFMIAPTGLIARAIATLVTGWTTPPPWITTQDPLGLGLIAALLLKETPFLLWALASQLNRDDLKQAFSGQAAVARSIGHGPRAIWLKLLLPQLLPRMVWPMIAVFAYGMTVVDMALVIGPAQPPTLAALIWTDINDGDIASNARGAAGVLMLSALTLFLLLVVWFLLRLSAPLVRCYYRRYPTEETTHIAFSGPLWAAWRLCYLMIGLALVLQSFSGHWPFPQLLASHLSVAAWQRLFADGNAVFTSLWLGLATTALALVASLVWLETQKPSRDRFVLTACIAALCLPALVIGLGQYRLLLAFGLTGTAFGLFFAHMLPVAAYVFVMLHGPYRGFDPRWRSVSAGLTGKPMNFLLLAKWPMLKAPLMASAAVGFAVSMAQYVPAQLAAAGRYSTLPMEAVTLSSGGNRTLIAVHALALMLLPLLAFFAAARFGKPRWDMP